MTFPKLSGFIHFSKTFPGLENAVLKFHDFSRFFMTVRTLSNHLQFYMFGCLVNVVHKSSSLAIKTSSKMACSSDLKKIIIIKKYTTGTQKFLIPCNLILLGAH